MKHSSLRGAVEGSESILPLEGLEPQAFNCLHTKKYGKSRTQNFEKVGISTTKIRDSNGFLAAFIDRKEKSEKTKQKHIFYCFKHFYFKKKR